MIDLLVVKETLCDDVYRLLEVEARDGIVVDVGAGIGEFTLFAADRSASFQVVAYEPNDHVFRLTESNVAGRANVILSPVAVGVQSSYRLRGVTNGPRATAVGGHSDAGVEVRGVRLDESLPEGPIRLLKIDCEGLELDVLQSAGRVIDRVEKVVVEFHRHLLPRADRVVADLLQRHGFRCVTRGDPYDDRIGYVYAERP